MKYIFYLLLTLFVISCAENEEFVTDQNTAQIIDKSQVLNASLKQQIEYKRYHMDIVSNWIANHGIDVIQSEIKSKEKFLFSSSNLVSTIDSNVSNEILVSELMESSAFNSNTIVHDSNTTDESMDKLLESLNAFSDLGEDSWYPSIRILESNHGKLKNTKTILSVEDADENGEKFTHYFIEEDGSLEKVDFAVSSDHAQYYNFIVLEIVKKSESEAEAELSKLSGQMVSYSRSNSRLELDQMKIKDLKEGWPSRSEIAFKGYKINLNPGFGYDCGDYIYSSDNCHSYSGNRITRLKRRYRNRRRNYDWDIERGENFSNAILVYVIFEEDSFPAPVKTASIPLPSSSSTNIFYRSWNSKYDQQALSNNNSYNLSSQNSFRKNNSSIEYNLRSYGF